MSYNPNLSVASLVEESDASSSENVTNPEEWDLKDVLSATEILSPDAKQCQTQGCNLIACCGWASKLGT